MAGTDVANPYTNTLVNRRGAGILMHVTSLPSSFGVGDIGAPAFSFVDFLNRSKQKYWQMLPLNPTGRAQGYSPYSSTASMAGSPFLISLENLKNDGLLSKRDLQHSRRKPGALGDLYEIEKVKGKLLNRAYINFEKRRRYSEFEKFINEQSYWLDDFSMFMLLKSLNGARSWHKWPDEYKKRNKKALVRLENEYGSLTRKIKWQQFVFHDQWAKLRDYCKKCDVALVGDIPFYVGHDSADVWANQQIFSLNADGTMKDVAGVPPDYFNSEGQLWGMPVFDWKELKHSGYRWWLQRLLRNTELYDIVRLDHFRAFAAFWRVAATQKTARNGSWERGPGKDFFNAVRKGFPDMPFIAEDLGDIDEHVYILRDRYKLPGMKVLQFAFDDPGKSSYSPHNHTENFIVYTGTHDNNTTRGWFRNDLNKKQKENVSLYAGKRITEDNVHLELTRLAYSSVARIAIIPMQDVLGLDETARMNTPASVDNNWIWRMRRGQVTKDIEKRLGQWMEIYNRL